MRRSLGGALEQNEQKPKNGSRVFGNETYLGLMISSRLLMILEFCIVNSYWSFDLIGGIDLDLKVISGCYNSWYTTKSTESLSLELFMNYHD